MAYWRLRLPVCREETKSAGKCQYLHGHNGVAIIALEAEKLDNRGMVLDFSDIKRVVNNWIDELSNREKEVLEGRFGLHDREPETLEVLSDRLGLTRERVRQIQNEALTKLKRHMVRSGIDKEALL